MDAHLIENYLKLPYTIEVVHDQGDNTSGWFGRVVEWPGCMTQADTFAELGEMIQDAMRAWVETALEEGQDIPAPRPVENYSGKFIVRVPKSLHRELIQAAERDGVSLNSFVNVALAKAVGEKLSAQPAIVIPQQDSARYLYSDNRLLQESAHQIREEETGEE